MNIIFSNTFGVLPEFAPKPATLLIPDWYKSVPSYINNGEKISKEQNINGTIKRCMPVFDAIGMGYLIVTPADVYVTEDDGGEPYYKWANYDLINFHPAEQAPNHPNRNGHMAYPKWINPWGIKTPKGYSTLFVNPMHHDLPFTILPGVVDTDTYTAPVNFPFVLNSTKWRGLIPAGTPIAQVIPFKREKWNMKLGTNQDIKESLTSATRLQIKIYDRYKNIFRAAKEYK